MSWDGLDERIKMVGFPRDPNGWLSCITASPGAYGDLLVDWEAPEGTMSPCAHRGCHTPSRLPGDRLFFSRHPVPKRE